MDKENKKLQEKFSRIYNRSKRANLDKINEIYEFIKQNQTKTKKHSTITEVSKLTKIPRVAVSRYVKILEKDRYIKKTKTYTPPYLRATTKKGDSEFIYGKENREGKIKEESKKILSSIKSRNYKFPSDFEQHIKSIENKDYNSKFLNSYNILVSHIWENYTSEDIYKLEIGSGANKYVIY